MLSLDRIDSAPILYSDFDTEFMQWIWVLIDSLNENLFDLENAVMSATSVSGTTQAVSINTRYVPTNSSLTTFQLPAMAQVGARVTIAGQGSGGWSLLTAIGQTVQIGDVGATATTSVSSSSRYDSIEIMCVLSNTTWITLSTQTTGFVIV
jgi:hypothetical protein